MLKLTSFQRTGKLILSFQRQQIRCGSSSAKYEIPTKRLPVHDGYLLDTRPKGEREVIDPGWKPKVGGYTKPLRIEIIDRQDYAFIGQYFTWHFAKYCNIFETQNLTYDEAAPFFFSLLNSVIDKPLSFAAFEGDKLVGIRLNTYHTADEFPDMYPRGLCEKDPKFVIQKDYDITNGVYPSRKLNRCNLCIEECGTQTGKFLPKDCKKLGVIEAAGVDSSYMGSGMAQYFSYRSMELFKKHGCDYWLSYSAAAAAAGFNLKVGGKVLFEFPYDDFKDCGKSVLTNMCDGAKSLKTIMGRVDKTWSLIQEYS
uniref:Uncharacterized protein n=1 Tax=Panagrolaimus sp. PS1159 TaxID=55785 RepID=A0AC35FH93_9BILA